MSPNGSWPDVNYTDRTRTGAWSPEIHVRRQLPMVIAVARKTNQSVLINATHKALGFWLALRAVQSPPFPPCAAWPRGGPGGGWGGPGLTPSAPCAKTVGSKTRSRPLCSQTHSLTNRRVNHVLQRSPRVHGYCGLRWPTECLLVASSFGGLRKDQMADASPT
jgi:hypothetical protein